MTLIGESDFVIFDEAQIVENIGTALKVLHDAHPHIQIIATGSSSFDLQSRIIEPLTGRRRDFMLFPFLWKELSESYGASYIERYSLDERLLYGSYPESLSPASGETPRDAISRIAEDYILKDILIFSGIRKSETLMKPLKVLAYQIGQEVSYGSIAKDFGMSIATIENYVDILEKAFIIFRLTPYHHNARSSITMRTHETISFWRDYAEEKIDLLIEKDGKITGYDCKWKYSHQTIALSSKAPLRDIGVITNENFMTFLGLAYIITNKSSHISSCISCISTTLLPSHARDGARC